MRKGRELLAKRKTIYICQECGYQAPKWMGKCTNCNSWNSFVEEMKQASRKRGTGEAISTTVSKPKKIGQIQTEKEERILTKMKELNRVLGGGIVPGSLVLIGGDPGIGKSTLLLQTSSQIAERNHTVLYISGEESLQQTKLRADRLNIHHDSLYVMAETDLYNITN